MRKMKFDTNDRLNKLDTSALSLKSARFDLSATDLSATKEDNRYPNVPTSVIPGPSKNGEIYDLQNEDFCYHEYPRSVAPML